LNEGFVTNVFFPFPGDIPTKMAVVVFVLILALVSPVSPAYTKPHIIMVVADDLVSFF
jgi:hypothetical protein